MKNYSRSHLTTPALLSTAAARLALERDTGAEFLADIGEIDARKAYVPAGYPSMHAWCVGELQLSAASALKRIQAARTARQFPSIFPAIADGRLRVSAVCLLAPHLNEGTATDLLTAVMGKTNDEIRRLLAQRFPRSEMLAMVEPLPREQHDLDHVETRPSMTAPIAPERYAIHLTIGQSTHDKLRYAQELLGHQVPSGDLAEVLDRSLNALIHQLEKTKFAASSRPRPESRSTASRRHIPAHVKRAVWERDGGQCTFVSESGHRCPARKPLEFDHIDPVARGGQATVERMRLRCRAHNQYEAERMFGTEFISHKRREGAEARAQAAAACARAQEATACVQEAAPAQKAAAASEPGREAASTKVASTAARARAAATCAAAETDRAKEKDVVPWLRQLGFRADEARRAATHCETILDAPLEERVRAALSFLQPRARVLRFGSTG